MSGSVSQSNTSGSQNQTQNTQQASNAAPPPWASAALQQAMLTAQSLAQMPFLVQPQPIAPLQPQQKEAFQTVENLQGAYTPFLEAGLGAIGQGAGMQGPAAQYQTPWGASQYFGAESAGVLPQLENIFGQQMAQTTGDLVNRAGGTDAERIAVGQGELANQQGLAAGQTLSQLMGQAVTQGQQAGMNLGQLGMNLGQLGGAAGNLANLGQTMGLQGAQAELNAGTLAQQQLQNMQNAIYANGQQAISWPFQTNAYLSTIASGLTPPAGGNMTQLGSMQGFGQNQSQTKGSSLGGSLGGLAGGLARGGRVAEAAATLRRLLEPDEDDDGHKHRGHGRQGVKAIARPLGYAEEPRSELDLIPGSSFADGGQVIAPSGRIATPMKGGGSTVSDPVDPQQRIDTLAKNQAVNQQLMGVPMGLGLPPGYNFDQSWRYDPAHPERPVPAANPFAGATGAYQTLYPTLPWTPVMPYRNAAFGPPASPTWQPAFESAANIDFRDPRYTQEAEAAGIPVPPSWDLGSGALQDQLNPWLVTEHTTGAFPTTAEASSGAMGALMAERAALTQQLGGMPSTPFSFAGPQMASGVPGAAMLPPAQQGAAPGRAYGGRVSMQSGGDPASPPATAAAAPTAPTATPTVPPSVTPAPLVIPPDQSYYGVPPPGTVFLGTPISGTTPGTALPWTQGASYPNLRAPGTVPGAPAAAPPPTPVAPAAPATTPAAANAATPTLVQGASSPGAPAPQGVPLGALTLPSLGVLPTRGPGQGQGQQLTALLGRAKGGRIPMQGGGISAPVSMFGGSVPFTFPGYGSQPGAVFFDPQNQVVPNTGGLWPYQGQIAGPTQQAAPTFGVNNFSGMGKGSSWGGGGWGGGGGGSPWMANQNPVNQQAVWPPPAAPMPTSGSMSMPWSGNMGKGFRTGGRIPMQGGGDPAQNPSPGIANVSEKAPLQVGSLTSGPVNPADPSPSAQSDPLGGIIAKPNLPPGKPLTPQSLGPPPFQQMKPPPAGQGKSGEGGGGGGGKPPKMPKPPGQRQGQGQGQGQGEGPAQPAPQAQPPADAQTDTGAPTGPTDPATGVPLSSNTLVPQVQVPTPQVDTPMNQFAAMTGGGGPFAGGGGGPFDVASSGDMGGFGDMGDMSSQDMAATDMAAADTGGGGGDFGGGDFGGGFGGFGARGGAFQAGGYATDSGYPSSSAPTSSTSSTLETPWNAYFLRGATDQAYSGEWNQPPADDSQLARRGGAIGRSLAIARRGMDEGGDPGAGGDVGDNFSSDEYGSTTTDAPGFVPFNAEREFDDLVSRRDALAGGTRALAAPLAGRPGAFPPAVPPPSPAPAPAPAPQAGTNASFANRFMPTSASRAIQVAQQPSGPAGVSRETVPGYGSDPLAGRPEERVVSDTNARIAQAAGFGQGYGGGQGGNTSWPSGGTHWTPQGPLGYPGSPGIPVTASMPMPQARPFGAPGVAPPLPSPRPEAAPGEVPLPQARPLMFNDRFAGMGTPAAPMGVPGSAWPGPGNVPPSGTLPQQAPTPYSAPGPLAANRPTWLPPHGGGIPQDVLPPVAGTSSAAGKAVNLANQQPPPAGPPPAAVAPPVMPTAGAMAQQYRKQLETAGIPVSMVPGQHLPLDEWVKQYPQYANDPRIKPEIDKALADHNTATARYQQQQQAQPKYPPQPLPAGQPRPPAAVFPDRVLAPRGEPKAFILHHTSGRGNPEDFVNDWRIHRPGVGAQYIMDRNGVIHDVGKEYGYNGRGHMVSGSGMGAGLSSQNTVGMEIIANNNKDITPQQVAAAREFVAARYPNIPVYGHGEVNPPPHREADEGMAAVRAIREARAGRSATAAAARPAGVNWDRNVVQFGPQLSRPAPATAATAPATTSPAVAVRGSWFGNARGQYNWNDPANGPRTASGRSTREPGIALPNRGTLGQWFEVTAPNGRKTVVQQTDVGPAAHTGRGVDITGAAAERLGYGPHNFPTDSTFHVRRVPPPQPGGGYQRGGYAEGSDVSEDAGQDTLLGSDAGDTIPKPITTTQETSAVKPMPGAKVPVPAAVPAPAPASAQPPQPEQRPPTEPPAAKVEAKPAPARQPQQPSRPEDRFAPPPGWGMNPFRAWLIDVLSGRAGAAYDFMRNRNAAIDEAWVTNYQRMKDQADERFLEGEPNDIATTMRDINKGYHDTIKKTPPAPAAGSTAPGPGTVGAAAVGPGAGAAPGQPGGAAAAAAAPQQFTTPEQMAIQENQIEQEMLNRARRHLAIPRAGGAEELTQLMDHRAARAETIAKTGLIQTQAAVAGFKYFATDNGLAWVDMRHQLPNGQPHSGIIPYPELPPKYAPQQGGQAGTIAQPPAPTTAPAIGGAPGAVSPAPAAVPPSLLNPATVGSGWGQPQTSQAPLPSGAQPTKPPAAAAAPTSGPQRLFNDAAVRQPDIPEDQLGRAPYVHPKRTPAMFGNETAKGEFERAAADGYKQIEGLRPRAEAARRADLQIDWVMDTLKGVPGKGPLATGTGFETRTALANLIHSGIDVANLPADSPMAKFLGKIDRNETINVSELDGAIKALATTLFGASATHGMSRGAGIFNTIMGQLPSPTDIRPAAARRLGALKAGLQFELDYDNDAVRWLHRNGTLDKFQEWEDANRSTDDYVAAGIGYGAVDDNFNHLPAGLGDYLRENRNASDLKDYIQKLERRYYLQGTGFTDRLLRAK